jgi:hypothetical protein
MNTWRVSWQSYNPRFRVATRAAAWLSKGLDGLATLIQKNLKKDRFSGHLFTFRGKKASILKPVLG